METVFARIEGNDFTFQDTKSGYSLVANNLTVKNKVFEGALEGVPFRVVQCTVEALRVQLPRLRRVRKESTQVLLTGVRLVVEPIAHVDDAVLEERARLTRVNGLLRDHMARLRLLARDLAEGLAEAQGDSSKGKKAKKKDGMVQKMIKSFVYPVVNNLVVTVEDVEVCLEGEGFRGGARIESLRVATAADESWVPLRVDQVCDPKGRVRRKIVALEGLAVFWDKLNPGGAKGDAVRVAVGAERGRHHTYLLDPLGAKLHLEYDEHRVMGKVTHVDNGKITAPPIAPASHACSHVLPPRRYLLCLPLITFTYSRSTHPSARRRARRACAAVDQRARAFTVARAGVERGGAGSVHGRLRLCHRGRWVEQIGRP